MVDGVQQGPCCGACMLSASSATPRVLTRRGWVTRWRARDAEWQPSSASAARAPLGLPQIHRAGCATTLARVRRARRTHGAHMLLIHRSKCTGRRSSGRAGRPRLADACEFCCQPVQQIPRSAPSHAPSQVTTIGDSRGIQAGIAPFTAGAIPTGEAPQASRAALPRRFHKGAQILLRRTF